MPGLSPAANLCKSVERSQKLGPELLNRYGYFSGPANRGVSANLPPISSAGCRRRTRKFGLRRREFVLYYFLGCSAGLVASWMAFLVSSSSCSAFCLARCCMVGFAKGLLNSGTSRPKLIPRGKASTPPTIRPNINILMLFICTPLSGGHARDSNTVA